ncbi:hypothetical protein PO909_007344 [Leuciscus waleckii]
MDPDSARQPQGNLGKASHAVIEAKVGPRGKHYLCGSFAAFTNIIVTFPIQKVLFRQQLHGVRVTEAVRQLQRDGLGRLYRGLLPPLLQKTTTVAIMFGLYEDFSRLLLSHARGSGAPEIVTRSTAAALAGIAEAALTPFERVQTLLQDHRHNGRFNNTAHTFRTLLRDYGVRECYRGNVLFFGLPLGIMFYPLNVVKSRAQAQVGGEFVPCRQVLMTVWRERGGSVAMLFRGATLNYHRSLLSWGIINSTYELLLKVF